MAAAPQVVVLTPVKNEAWILNHFLTVTTSFADLIIIVDEGSTDGSQEICRRFAKVLFYQKTVESYNEATRQLFLIERARELVPKPRILLALDADEILAANATRTSDWQTMLQAKPGTVLYFEKPDLTEQGSRCVRYRDNPSPLGYVDDGASHQCRLIHSIRIPHPKNAPLLVLDEVKIMHYAHVRSAAQNAKVRLYSVIENVKRTEPWHRRLRTYDADRKYLAPERREPTPAEWFEGRDQSDIAMTSAGSEYYWQDFEVLRNFNMYGVKRFWLDDIWKVDWEQCRLFAQAKGIPDIPTQPIPSLSIFRDVLRRTLKRVLALYTAWKGLAACTSQEPSAYQNLIAAHKQRKSAIT